MNKQIKDNIQKISGGLFFSAADLVLYSCFLLGESFFKSPGNKGVYEMFSSADKSFNKINSRVIYNALCNLKNRDNYISKHAYKNLDTFKISENGYKYLNKTLPSYKTNRSWNKKFYLISFDIPEKKRSLRDSIRRLIKKNGGGLLQISLWITPYFPKWIDDIEGNLHKDAWIIISELTEKGLYPFNKIGMTKLIQRVYQLDELNNRYKNFIISSQKINGDKLQKMFTYLNILKDDPQLPFELEPKGFSGKHAFECFRKLKE